jgi:hypothetical protein
MKLLVFVGFYFLIQQQAFAEEVCYLSHETQYADFEISSQYHIGQKSLNCTLSSNANLKFIKGYNKNTLKIVRAHELELKGFNKLTSSHGYHLINQEIDCKKLHCDHINVISLDDFKNIQKFTTKSESLKANISIQSLVDEINPNSWLLDIVTLSSWSRVSGSSDNNLARSFIENRLNSLNLQVSNQSFIVNGNATNNIIGVQVGSTKPNDWYIVGAHMDSTSSRDSAPEAPGAVDNASGCSGVMELARVASGYFFSSTILFICYSGEEQGLIGSYLHANTIFNNGNQNNVKAALIMDMIGYTSNSGHDLLLETSASNQGLMDTLAQNAAIYAPQLTVSMSTNFSGSDHVPYILNDMHGILSIDDDWNVYPGYHRSTDLPENINLNQGHYILKTNLAALAQLAELNDKILFKNSFE